MARTANYFISGIWKNSNGKITDVFLHEVTENDEFYSGKKLSEIEVIKLIKSKNIIKTIYWSYPGWIIGAIVDVVDSEKGSYLRTLKDKTAKDNLDNLIDMKIFNN